VATVTITNPPLATMDPETLFELAELLPQLEAPDIRAVISPAASRFFIRHYSWSSWTELPRAKLRRDPDAR
jgi:hypothetical protein